MAPQTTLKSLVEVKTYLDELLQVDGLDESGNGLVVGGRPAVGKVGLAVNCSFQAIEGAARRDCDLLITHHAAWPNIDQLLSEQKYARLRRLGINYYAAHECLDLARKFGTADALARAVRVAVQGTFDLAGEAIAVHGMTTGHLAEFVTRVGNQLGIEPRRWKNSDSFGHVAIVPGWGGRTDWMAQAQELGCDTFLTGEASMFSLLYARETGLNLEVTFIPEEVVEAKG
jgi:putative NIF3 family GTP cyclohydrolase 1 type 2